MQRPLVLLFAAAILCGVCDLITAQEQPSSEAAIADAPTLPLPIQTGARWLRYALLAPLQSGAAPIPAESTTAESTTAEEVTPEAREIIVVQQRLGGSVVQGAVFDLADQREVPKVSFAKALESHLKQHAVENRCDAPTQQPLPPTVQHLPVPLAPSHFASVVPKDAVRDAGEHLRSSARNLDVAAADLEDAGKYTEADRLRELAQTLREEARELVQAIAAGKGMSR